MSNANLTYVRKYLSKALAQLAKEVGFVDEHVIAELLQTDNVEQFYGWNRACLRRVNRNNAAAKFALLICQCDDRVHSADRWVEGLLDGLRNSCVVVEGREPGNQLHLYNWLTKFAGEDIGIALRRALKVMPASLHTQLQRRLARVGGLQLSPTSSLGVWAYANVQGSERQVTIDVHTGCGFFSLELPTGIAQQLEKLLRAGAYMAEAAGEMSAEEWAQFEAAESAATARACAKGGAS